MLDISIKALDKAITSAKKAADFVRRHISAVEKIDGTKLTLVRNDEAFDPRDYTKNWVVSYKGSIIYPSEFSGLEDKDEDIREKSIGSSQYKFVHDHLRKIHGGTGSIPPGTEFFVEFVQNKPTITRDYASKHGMYLVGFGDAQYAMSRGQLYTTTNFIDDPTRLDEYRRILQLGAFPVVFEGNLSSRSTILAGCKDDNLRSLFRSSLENIDFSDPLQIVRAAVETFSSLESSLGGAAEGVVIQVGDPDMTEKQLYKVLAADQHSKETRSAKKSRYKGSEAEEDSYWEGVNLYVDELLDGVKRGSPESMMGQLSKKVYSLKKPPVAHPVKELINMQDDIMLTAKLRLLSTGSHRATKVAVIPMAAKPFHAGHASLIEEAVLDGNESIILFISTGGREEIGVGDMVPLWKKYYIPGIEREYGEKVIIRFSDSPLKDASLVARSLAKTTGTNVRLYGDPADAQERVASILDKNPDLEGLISAAGVSREGTGGISGTQMRGYLTSGDAASFKENLPEWLSPDEKEGVWSSLSKKYVRPQNENMLRSFVRLLLDR
jgi:hypothetical protein